MPEPRLAYFKLFPSDWRSHQGVQSCPLEARGLWFELLCLMHDSPRRGVLLTPAGEPMPVKLIARLVGSTSSEVGKLLNQLQAAGVYAEQDGAIVSRRMVRDEAERQAAKVNGRKGGNPALKRPTETPLTPGLTPRDNPQANPQSPEARVQSQNPPYPPPGGGADAVVPHDLKPKRAGRRKPTAEPPGFAEFWELYPKKVDRLAAVKAFATIAPGPDLEAAILAGVRRYAAYVAGYEPAHVKNPSGWLTNKRWTDNLPDPATPDLQKPADIVRRTDERLEALNQPVPPANWQRGRTQTLFPQVEANTDDQQ